MVAEFAILSSLTSQVRQTASSQQRKIRAPKKSPSDSPKNRRQKKSWQSGLEN